MVAIKNNIIIIDDYAVMNIHSDTHGDFEVLIDIEDIPIVEDYRWGILKVKSNRCDYTKYYISSNGNKYLLHRVLTNCPKGMVVDHIDGNSLNNRRNNIRVCTFSENRMNNLMYKNNQYGHIGVCWYPHRGLNKWMAHIAIDKKKIHLGYYDTYEEACRAREEAEIKYFGEFSNENNYFKID